MNKQEFEKSKDPYMFVVSINPETGKSNYEYLEGYTWDWMRDLVKKDFPERFVFGRLNKAAAKLRAKEVFGLTDIKEI